MSDLRTQQTILKNEAPNRQRLELTRIVTSNPLKCKTFLYLAKDFAFVQQIWKRPSFTTCRKNDAIKVHV